MGIQSELAREVCEEFPEAGTRTLANKLMKDSPAVYKDYEAARGAIRYVRGENGARMRKKVGDRKTATSKPKVGLLSIPDSDAEPITRYVLNLTGAGAVLADLHVPYHDATAIRLALAHAEKTKHTDFCILNGDGLDCYQLSQWEKDPRKRRFASELKVIGQILDVLCNTFGKVVYKFGNHECFDDATECLTADGWVHHSKLTDKTLVGTYNIKTNAVEYQVPTAVHRSQHNGEMVHIKSDAGVDILVTENHRLLFKQMNYHYPNKWTIKEASKINFNMTRYEFPVAGTSGLPDCDLSDDEIRIAAWILTDGGVYWRTGRDGVARPVVSFYQRPQKEKLISDILDRLGWEYSRHERHRDIKAICGKTLKKKVQPQVQFSLCGESRKKAAAIVSTKAKFPAWVYRMSDRQFDIFLSNFVDGDGSRHKSAPETSWMVYGTKGTIDDLQRACVGHGWRSTISEYRPGNYRLNVNKKRSFFVDRIINHVSREKYKGTVWCVTTPNDTVMVRRNGRPVATGNSRYDRYMKLKAPELLDLPGMELNELMGLEEKGIEFVAHNRIIEAAKLNILHGHEYARGLTSPVNPARGMFLRAKACTISAHNHQTSHHNETDIRGVYTSCWSIGCLCGLSPEYAPLNRWNHGFALLEFDGHDFEVVNKRVVDGKVV